MSGIGKYRLAQEIYFCIKNNSVSVEWFHEEESKHLIYQKQFEKLLENGNCIEYKNLISDKWNSFLNSNIKQT